MATPDRGIRTAQLSSLFLLAVTPSQVKSHHHLSPGIPARRGSGALLTKLLPRKAITCLQTAGKGLRWHLLPPLSPDSIGRGDCER